MGERRFLPFFCAQACGAFNDNLLKNVLIILVTYQAARWSALRPELLANIAAALFIAPFVVFSGIAGQLGERFDKTRILKCVKALEILIMLVAAVGFLQHRVALLLFALFMMGVHSSFFAPAKYGLLPEVLNAEEYFSWLAVRPHTYQTLHEYPGGRHVSGDEAKALLGID